ncbi:hypothetical protein [Streptomyces sp. NPDC017941]|uniref:hypothetical protein n=1 Tax=Streptomyces sp. NPDC017941 TaxID=3365018 RepID=UPI003789446E
MLIAAALVAAVAVGAVSAAVLLLGRDGDGGGVRTVPPSSVGPDAPDDSAPRPTATSTVTRTPDTVRPSTPEAPENYRIAKDPRGFALAVPKGYVRETDGPRTYYSSPGGVVRIGIDKDTPRAGTPLAAQRRSHAAGPRDLRGYRDGEVTGTTRNGRPAALWQYTWDGSGADGGARHTFDLCWEENGRMYHVWVSSPVGRAGEARRYFDTAVDTFVRR